MFKIGLILNRNEIKNERMESAQSWYQKTQFRVSDPSPIANQVNMPPAKGSAIFPKRSDFLSVLWFFIGIGMIQIPNNRYASAW